MLVKYLRLIYFWYIPDMNKFQIRGHMFGAILPIAYNSSSNHENNESFWEQSNKKTGDEHC